MSNSDYVWTRTTLQRVDAVVEGEEMIDDSGDAAAAVVDVADDVC